MTEPDLHIFTAEESVQIRARQAARSKIMALILGGLCVLFFAITIVKIGYLS